MSRIVLIRSNAVNPDPPVEKMANSLIGFGHKVIIIGWDRDFNYRIKKTMIELKNGCCLVIRFGIKADFGSGLKGNLFPLIIFQKRIHDWLYLNESEFDVIHAFDFDTGFVANYFARKKKKKLVYHILDYYIDAHDIGNIILKKLVQYCENNIINSASATVICTEKRKNQIKGTLPQKLYIIHNTPDKKSINFNKHIIQVSNKTRMRVVYVGVLAGSRMLLELCEIIGNRDDIEFHIGGFGKIEEEILLLSKKYNNIFFYGKLPYESTLALENDCDVMVAIYDPSVRNHRFAAPNKFYESLMIGKPIIMAKNTGFDDVIEEHQIGILVQYSKEDVSNGLDKIIKLKKEWVNMSERSLNMYKERYSWKIMEERIRDMYTNL